MRRTRVTCGITRKSHNIDEDGEFGTPEILDENPLADVPAGWGAITIQQVRPNPEYTQVQKMRETAQAGLEERLQLEVAKAREANEAPSDSELDIAREAMQRQLDTELPLPPEFVCVEWDLGDVSPEGMDIVFAALNEGLKKAGATPLKEPVFTAPEAAADA